jgi:predicted transcriptional regulator
MGPLTPYIMYIKIGAAILVIALSFGAGYRLKTMQVAEKENELLKAAIAENERLQKEYNALSGKVIELAGQNDTIQTRTIERVTTEVEKPVYRECVVPASGIEILNAQVEELNKSIRGEVIK